jgi:hypothetical protein
MTDELGRRREAALRLPPLADGRRDPVLELTHSGDIECARCGCHLFALKPGPRRNPRIICDRCGTEFGLAIRARH